MLYNWKDAIVTINEENNSKRKTVVVLGCSRSGTSMFAGMLREMGVHFEEPSFYTHEWSPISENGKLLSEDQVLATTFRLDEKHPVWGWKLPSDIFHISKVCHLLRNPHFIVVMRCPFDTMAAYDKYSSLEPEVSMKEIMEVNSAIAEFVRGTHHPVSFVGYEAARRNPEGLVAKIINDLGLDCTQAQRKRAVSFIRPEGGYRSVTKVEDGKAQYKVVVHDDLDLAVGAVTARLGSLPPMIDLLKQRVSVLAADLSQACLIADNLDAQITEQLNAAPLQVSDDFFQETLLMDDSIIADFYQAAPEQPAVLNDRAEKQGEISEAAPDDVVECLDHKADPEDEANKQKSRDILFEYSKQAALLESLYRNLRRSALGIVKSREELQRNLTIKSRLLTYLKNRVAAPPAL